MKKTHYTVFALLTTALLVSAAPYTAPDGDLNQDGNVSVQDLQCLVLVFDVLGESPDGAGQPCSADGDCSNIPDSACRAGFAGERVCLPDCVGADVGLGPDETIQCSSGGGDTPDCIASTQKRMADLNCDGFVGAADFVFLVSLTIGKVGLEGTPDHDGDGMLNFCDNDTDGDSIADEEDCAPLDNAHGDCDDLDQCTDDLCADGECQHTPVVCDDNDEGTLDSCNPATGCVFQPAGPLCDEYTKVLDTGGNLANYSGIGIHNDYVHIAYWENAPNRTKYVRSTNLGETFSAAKVIDSINGWYHDMAVNGPNIWVSYFNYGSIWDMRVVRSHNNGTSWTQSLVDNKDVGDFNAVCAGGDGFYLTYREIKNSGGTWTSNLKFVKSGAGGQSWSTGKLIATDGTGWHPSVAADGAKVWVAGHAQQNGGVFKLRRSTNGGDSWASPVTIDTFGLESAIAVSGNSVYLVWRNPGDDELKFARSDDGGQSWPENQRSTVWAGNGSRPAVKVSGQFVYALANGPMGLRFAKSLDNGSTWPEELYVDLDADGAFGDLAIDGEGCAHISYKEQSSMSVKYQKFSP